MKIFSIILAVVGVAALVFAAIKFGPKIKKAILDKKKKDTDGSEVEDVEIVAEVDAI